MTAQGAMADEKPNRLPWIQDSRHWGLNTFDDFPGPNRFNGLDVAKIRYKKELQTPCPEQGRGFYRSRPSLTARSAELLSGLPHDRGRWFQANADAAALVDIGAFGGNAPHDFLGGQYCWQRSPP